MTPPKRTYKPRRMYTQSGYYAAKRALMRFGNRTIDGRTSLGKALNQWRAELVNHLGGADSISKQQAVILDLAARTHLLLQSVDNWLLQQPSLVNHRKRALLPVVVQRQQLADSLARYMTTLGLERRAKPVPALRDYITEKYNTGGETTGPERNERDTK